MNTAKESVRALHSLLTRRKRFTASPGVLGLDLAYITDRVLVCSFPYELPLFFSRNTAGELLKFLESSHKDHYKVYNLCSERKYDHTKFKGRVAEFPISPNEAPQLYTIYSFIKDANKWLDADGMNVIVVHCDNGRDRAGMMIAAWLLQTKRCLTASHAITFFASVRGGINPCVTTPSQRRYVEYVERVLTEKMPAIKLVVLEKITIYTVPMFNLRGGCSPWFSISKLNKSIFYSKSLDGKKGKMTIDFECNFIQLQGDIVITFFDGKFSRFMFRISFHSSFVRGKTVTFYPRDIDGPHADLNHKNFNPEFKVTLHFSSVALLPAEQISADDVVPQTKKYSFEDVLNIPTLREAYRGYLVDHKGQESLDFYKHVQRYKETYVPSLAKLVATKMYNKYLQRYAPEEVNVSHEARQDVEEGLVDDVPSQGLFALAEKEIYSLMRNDTYPRFIISDLFFKACADLSDYVVPEYTRLAPTPAKPTRANTTTPASATEKQSAPKRFLTSAADTAAATLYPLYEEDLDIVPTSEKYDYSTAFKPLHERPSGSKTKSPRSNVPDQPKSPRDPSKQPTSKIPTNSPEPPNLSKQEQLEAKKGFSSTRSNSPPSKNQFASSSTASNSISPRVHHTESDKRGDFIKGDYRNSKSESQLSHLDLSTGRVSPSLRRDPVSSPLLSLPPAVPNQSLSNSSPAAFENPQTNQASNTTRQPLQLMEPKPLSSTSKTKIPARPPTPTFLHPSTPAVSPNNALPRKNISQQIQSLMPNPAPSTISRSPSSNLFHSSSEPLISYQQTSPTPLISKSDDSLDSSFRSRSPIPSNPPQQQRKVRINDQANNNNQQGIHQKTNGTSNRHSPTYSNHDIPPRPETPSHFSPSVLSFDRSIPHETPKSALRSTSAISPPPSSYPAQRNVVDPAEALKVIDNMKLVCVECRKQIGNKDVVVSFMHHYYHWGCVRCAKCKNPLSSDCVISGDKPYCGECEDSFFNKCTACGLAITETCEEQRVDKDGNTNCWHRRCFTCIVCGLTSNSDRPVDRFAGDNNLYCVFHHPEPKSVPVSSAQDIREDDFDSLDLSDEEEEEESAAPTAPSSPHVHHLPPRFPPSSPAPSLVAPPLSTPLAASSVCSSPHHVTKALPATPKPLPATPTPKPRTKPLPPLPPVRPTVATTTAVTPPPSRPHATTTTASATPRQFNHADDAYFPGVCVACSCRIPKTGHLLLAGSAQYHPACFVCSVCATPITGSYQELNGTIYCPLHCMHANRIQCSGCGDAIAPGKYLVVGNEKYHVECFGCKLCGLQFRTEHSYYELWGGHICLSCYDATMKVRARSRTFRRG